MDSYFTNILKKIVVTNIEDQNSDISQFPVGSLFYIRSRDRLGIKTENGLELINDERDSSPINGNAIFEGTTIQENEILTVNSSQKVVGTGIIAPNSDLMGVSDNQEIRNKVFDGDHNDFQNIDINTQTRGDIIPQHFINNTNRTLPSSYLLLSSNGQWDEADIQNVVSIKNPNQVESGDVVVFDDNKLIKTIGAKIPQSDLVYENIPQVLSNKTIDADKNNIINISIDNTDGFVTKKHFNYGINANDNAFLFGDGTWKNVLVSQGVGIGNIQRKYNNFVAESGVGYIVNRDLNPSLTISMPSQPNDSHMTLIIAETDNIIVDFSPNIYNNIPEVTKVKLEKNCSYLFSFINHAWHGTCIYGCNELLNVNYSNYNIAYYDSIEHNFLYLTHPYQYDNKVFYVCGVNVNTYNTEKFVHMYTYQTNQHKHISVVYPGDPLITTVFWGMIQKLGDNVYRIHHLYYDYSAQQYSLFVYTVNFNTDTVTNDYYQSNLGMFINGSIIASCSREDKWYLFFKQNNNDKNIMICVYTPDTYTFSLFDTMDNLFTYSHPVLIQDSIYFLMSSPFNEAEDTVDVCYCYNTVSRKTSIINVPKINYGPQETYPSMITSDDRRLYWFIYESLNLHVYIYDTVFRTWLKFENIHQTFSIDLLIPGVFVSDTHLYVSGVFNNNNYYLLRFNHNKNSIEYQIYSDHNNTICRAVKNDYVITFGPNEDEKVLPIDRNQSFMHNANIDNNNIILNKQGKYLVKTSIQKLQMNTDFKAIKIVLRRNNDEEKEIYSYRYAGTNEQNSYRVARITHYESSMIDVSSYDMYKVILKNTNFADSWGSLSKYKFSRLHFDYSLFNIRDCCFAEDKDKIYIFNGEKDGNIFNKIYSIHKNNFIKNSSIEEIYASSGYYIKTNINNIDFNKKAAGAFVYQDRIYVIGGININGNYTNSMICYDINTDQFITKTSLPINLAHINTSTVFDGNRYCYVVGGYNGSQCINKIYRYDVLNDVWVEISGPGGITNMNYARMSVCYDHASDCLFIFGGDNMDTQNPLNRCNNNKVIVYNITDNRIIKDITIPSNLSEVYNRCGAAIYRFEDFIVFYGGHTYNNFNQEVFNNVIAVYDLLRYQWHTLTIPSGFEFSSGGFTKIKDMFATFSGKANTSGYNYFSGFSILPTEYTLNNSCDFSIQFEWVSL